MIITRVSSFYAPLTRVHKFYSTAVCMSEKLKAVVEKQFPVHPFSAGITERNRLPLMRNYLAMSQAFPYLQAGSQKDLIFSIMEKNVDVPEDIEKTSVVGNFLCWDETGGNQLMLTKGVVALPEILRTRQQFHANLLKKDLKLLFQENVQPDYSAVTVTYLKELHKRLSSPDQLVRCSMMIGFEMHAYEMITALWQSISTQFRIGKEHLSYFQTHVGGKDPAEIYHVQMTQSLVKDLVLQRDEERFIKEFQDSYALNINWCQSLTYIEDKKDEVRFSRLGNRLSIQEDVTLWEGENRVSSKKDK